MTDIRAGEGAPDEEDRLPWLEAVEEDESGEGPSVLKLIVAVLIGLAAIGGLVGGLFWLNQRGAAPGGSPELIKAPPGAYKVRPDDPGGMKVEGEGDTAFNTAHGATPAGNIDTNGVPETPVKGQAKPGEGPLLKAPPPSNEPAQPGSAGAAAGGATIQLGAFPDGASAEKAWKALSGRFAYLAPLAHSVVTANVNGKTWYRLRASGAGAAGICGRLQVAGEQCLKVD
ncbi:MAG TPA: SPOR domain-containing protein [Allosphingosinicella sp.]|nr:SPOR domain-containing protein [Allosphingosinicella sp.]